VPNLRKKSGCNCGTQYSTQQFW